jgi:hypothetical protein
VIDKVKIVKNVVRISVPGVVMRLQDIDDEMTDDAYGELKRDLGLSLSDQWLRVESMQVGVSS